MHREITVTHNHIISLDQNVIDLAKKFLINLDSFNFKLDKVMKTVADLQASTQKLIDAVTAEDTVIGSLNTFLQGLAQNITDLKEQLAEAVANNNPAAIDDVVTKLDALGTDINTQTANITTAITANTPVAAATTGTTDTGTTDTGAGQ